MNIRGKPLAEYTPSMVAKEFYRGGEGQDSNPYRKGSADYDTFMMEMGLMQLREMTDMQAALRVGK